jgi:hypothetical protein
MNGSDSYTIAELLHSLSHWYICGERIALREALYLEPLSVENLSLLTVHNVPILVGVRVVAFQRGRIILLRLSLAQE